MEKKMKKLILTTAITTLFLTACSQPVAQNQVFGDKSSTNMTISQVKSQYDDALVTFTGKIIKQIDGEDYLVADSTDSIQVEIDNHIWRGLNVTPNDTIRIHGKVDKETFSTQVDAFSIEKVN